MPITDLRPFQKEFRDLIETVALGRSGIESIIAHVTPGGGKSFLPASCKPILGCIADKVLWVVPRINLAEDAEKKAKANGLPLRYAGNGTNPSRDVAGYITTYHAICAQPLLHAHEFNRYRYVLILDEPHHVEDGGEWERALRPLWDTAVLRVLMSGTLERGSRDAIAFLPYGSDGKPDLKRSGIKSISYPRSQALEDHAIVPLEFIHIDGAAQWIDQLGQKREESLSDTTDAREATRTALVTEYATDLLKNAVLAWKNYRAKTGKEFSQMLIVAKDIESSKRLAEAAQALTGSEVVVATSDDAKASKAIGRFCRGEVPILSTCQMAYEGMDAPAITHVVCLTHIRSKPWIEQMFARAVRKHAGKNKAWIFCPDDSLMNELIEQIRSEQVLSLKEADEAESKDAERADKPGHDLTNILPLTSEATGARLTELDGETCLTSGQVVWLQNQGIFQDFGEVARIVEMAGGKIPELDQEKLERGELSYSEEEALLRSKIQQACNRCDRQKGVEFGATNLDMLKTFNVARSDMTLPQLRKAWAWIQQRLARAA